MRKWMLAAVLAAMAGASPASQLLMIEHDAAADAAGLARRLGVSQRTVETVLRSRSTPVHERITLSAYGCLSASDCPGRPEYRRVLLGVIWNDNPPGIPKSVRWPTCWGELVLMPKHRPDCWIGFIGDAMVKSKTAPKPKGPPQPLYGEDHLMLYRTHYGDMQFLHAMASADGEPPQLTLERILAWSQYAYRLGLRQGADRLPVNRPIAEFAPMQPWFRAGKRDWTAQTLFRLGQDHNDMLVRDVAFGALLHTVQDSYSRSHTGREFAADGGGSRILEHYSYTGQSTTCHDQPDKEGYPQSDADPVQVRAAIAATRRLIALRDANAPWSEVEAVLRGEIFVQDPAARPASAGRFKPGDC